MRAQSRRQPEGLTHMATLIVPVTTNFSASALSNIDIIDFTNVFLTSATATFVNTQFNNAAILNTVHIDGSLGTNRIIINGGDVNASLWTFATWSGTDTITINGNASAQNILHGSTAGDTVNGGGFEDDIFGEGGADLLFGGASDDAFRFTNGAQVVSGLQIDGGTQTDKIALNSGTGYDFSLAAIINVERLDFFSGAQTATFDANQLGAGKINQFVAQAGGPATLNIINAASLNLSTAAFTGFGGSDVVIINGTAGNDVITGSSVSDTIIGGIGADTMNGGGGDDQFVLNGLFDFTTGEVFNGGTGTGDALVVNIGANALNNFALATITDIEKLVFGASGGGGGFSDTQFGTAAGRINAVTGGAAADQLQITGSAINISGVTFSSWTLGVDKISLSGTGGADVILGSSLDDIISGNGGGDALFGGLGDDTLSFSSGVTVIDGGGGSGDRLSAAFTTDLSAAAISGVELLQLQTLLDTDANITAAGTQFGATGFSAVAGTSRQDDLIVKGPEVDLSGVTFTSWTDGSDVVSITGTAAADVLIGSTQRDIIQSGIGADQLFGFGGNDELYGGNDADYMSGGDGADYMSGGAAKDVFFGGAGIDTMLGGAGDDEFYVSAADLSDIIVEYAGEGNDRIFASVSYSLAANAEIETLGTDSNAGTASVNLTASNLANVVIGNNGTNVLDGRGGNDILFGLGGTDFFTFSTAPNAANNIDTIADFVSADDVIFLDDAAFSGMTAGFLSANGFLSGAGLTSAATAAQHVIHNSATGDLYYDQDGLGGLASVRFANIGAATSVASFDFFGI